MKKTLLFLSMLLSAAAVSAAEIYVSPSGDDFNDGSGAKPKATLHAALRQARELRRLQKTGADEPVRIIMRGGIYNLYEPVFIRPEDSGSETSPTIIEAAAGEYPVLSGGMRIDGWKKEGKYWTADVPEFNGNRIEFRQFWVDGKKAARARNVADFDKMDVIRGVDKRNQILWVPASAVKNIAKADVIELVLHQMWAIANLRIKSIDIQGDSAAIRFHNPESRIEFEHPWPPPMVGEGHNSPFYMTNSLEFLDEPGEWFLDAKKNKVYYIPRTGEDMRRAQAVAPVLEKLVEITGTIDRPVKYIQFKGIGFNYTTWMRPSEKGHVPIQAGMYLLDAYKLRPPGVPGNFNRGIENQAWVGRPPAAVTVSGAQYTQFKECRFEHLGSCALDFSYASQHDMVSGSLFRDIGGNALQIGKISDIGMETHLPYDPTDTRELCSHQNITDNYITDIGNDDWGCVAICAGYVRDINIEHNEISEIPYSGISLGWGWTKTVNSMRNNRIHANHIHHYARHMYDVAGIYTLSVQSKTAITENVVENIYKPPYVHDPNHWFYLYTDEGSSFMTIKDNWTPTEKFLQNANGPGNTWENNGPMVADSIRQKAGIREEYKWLKNLR